MYLKSTFQRLIQTPWFLSLIISIIFLAVFILFGAKSLPDIARGLGQSVRIFRKEMEEIKTVVEQDNKTSAKPSLTLKEDNPSVEVTREIKEKVS